MDSFPWLGWPFPCIHWCSFSCFLVLLSSLTSLSHYFNTLIYSWPPPETFGKHLLDDSKINFINLGLWKVKSPLVPTVYIRDVLANHFDANTMVFNLSVVCQTLSVDVQSLLMHDIVLELYLCELPVERCIENWLTLCVSFCPR